MMGSFLRPRSLLWRYCGQPKVPEVAGAGRSVALPLQNPRSPFLFASSDEVSHPVQQWSPVDDVDMLRIARILPSALCSGDHELERPISISDFSPYLVLPGHLQLEASAGRCEGQPVRGASGTGGEVTETLVRLHPRSELLHL